MCSPLSLGIPIINHFKGYIFQIMTAEGSADVAVKMSTFETALLSIVHIPYNSLISSIQGC